MTPAESGAGDGAGSVQMSPATPGTTGTTAAAAASPKSMFMDPQPSEASLRLLREQSISNVAQVPSSSSSAATEKKAEPSLILGLWPRFKFMELAIDALLASLAFCVLLVALVFPFWLAVCLTLALVFLHSSYLGQLRDKFRANARICAIREASQARAQLAAERADWLNALLARFWIAMEPMLSRTIQDTVEPILESVRPGFLDSLKFSHFCLGTFPPQLASFITANSANSAADETSGGVARPEPDLVDLQFSVYLGYHGELPSSGIASSAPGRAASAVQNLVTGSVSSVVGGLASVVSAGVDGAKQLTQDLSPVSNISANTASQAQPLLQSNDGPPDRGDAESMPHMLLERCGSAALLQESERLPSRVELVIRASGVAVNVSVQNICFEARVRVRMKLMGAPPFIKVLEMWLCEPPKVAFELRPLGSFDLTALGTFRRWLDSAIASAISENLVYPHPLVLDIDAMMNSTQTDRAAPIGILVLHISHATDLANLELLGTSDPVVKVQLNGAEVADTEVVHSTRNPVWDDRKFIAVPGPTLRENTLKLVVQDNDRTTSNKTIGSAEIDLGALESQPSGGLPLSLALPLVAPASRLISTSERKSRGTLHVAASFVTVLDSPGNTVPSDDCISGILRITVHAARGLATQGNKKLRSPYAEIFVNGLRADRTTPKKHTNAPLWEHTFYTVATDYKTASVKIVICDSESTVPIAGIGAAFKQISNSSDPVLGSAVLNVASALKASGKDDWYVLHDTQGLKDARVRVSMSWRGVPLSGHDGAQALGVVRLSLGEASTKLPQKPLICPFLQVCAGRKVLASSPRLIDVSPSQFNFNSSVFFIVQNMRETIELKLNNHDAESVIGESSLSVHEYATQVQSTEPAQQDKPVKLEFKDSNNNGKATINALVHYCPKKQDTAAKPQLNAPSKQEVAASSPEDSVCGILKVNVHAARGLARKANVFFEVYIDNPKISLFKSGVRRKTQDPSFQQSVDVFCRQLNRSTLHIVLREDSGDQASQNYENVLACFDTLVEQVYTKSDPEWYDATPSGQLRLSFEFVQVNYNLRPEDKLYNLGVLHVTVVSASNVPRTDVAGRCDPFIELWIDNNIDAAVKTTVKKRTLKPVYNEDFKFNVASREFSSLKVALYDWDRVGDNTLIGTAPVHMGMFPVDQTEKVQAEVQVGKATVLLACRFESCKLKKIPALYTGRQKSQRELLDPRRAITGTGNLISGITSSAFRAISGHSSSNNNSNNKVSNATIVGGTASKAQGGVNVATSGLHSRARSADDLPSPSNASLTIEKGQRLPSISADSVAVAPGTQAQLSATTTVSASSGDIGSGEALQQPYQNAIASLSAYVSGNPEKAAERGVIAIEVKEAYDLHHPGSSASMSTIPSSSVTLILSALVVRLKTHYGAKKKHKYETKPAVRGTPWSPGWDQGFAMSLPKASSAVLKTPFEAEFSVWCAPSSAQITQANNLQDQSQAASLMSPTCFGECKVDLWAILYDRITSEKSAPRTVQQSTGISQGYVKACFSVALTPMSKQPQESGGNPKLVIQVSALLPETYFSFKSDSSVPSNITVLPTTSSSSALEFELESYNNNNVVGDDQSQTFTLTTTQQMDTEKQATVSRKSTIFKNPFKPLGRRMSSTKTKEEDNEEKEN